MAGSYPRRVLSHHVPSPLVALRLRQKSRKFFLYPELEHIAETRPSSSEFIVGIETRRCEFVIAIATRGIVTVLVPTYQSARARDLNSEFYGTPDVSEAFVSIECTHPRRPVPCTSITRGKAREPGL